MCEKKLKFYYNNILNCVSFNIYFLTVHGNLKKKVAKTIPSNVMKIKKKRVRKPKFN